MDGGRFGENADDKGKVYVPGANLPPKDASSMSCLNISFLSEAVLVLLVDPGPEESLTSVLIVPTSESLSKHAG